VSAPRDEASSIRVRGEDANLIRRAANAAGVDEMVLVACAVQALAAAVRPIRQSREERPLSDEVELYAVYRHVHVKAVYFPATRLVKITDGPLAGRTFRTSSAAAGAVVEQVTSGRPMSRRSGPRFWRVTATGERLEVLVSQPNGRAGSVLTAEQAPRPSVR
jgi:hypothetical protein